MLRTIFWAGTGTAFPFLMTTLGSATVYFFPKTSTRKFQRVLLGFAAGVMTAASIWSLLLPALAQSAENANLPVWLPASVGLALGVAFLAFLDDRFARLAKSRENVMLMTAITLHNVPEGMAVGLAFALAAGGDAMAAAGALAFGIGIQNFPEGAAVALPLRQDGWNRTKAFLFGTLSGAVEPLFGVLAALFAAVFRPVMPWLLSFAAGAMLYVVVEELVPQAHSRGGTHGFVVGFLIMMVLDVALG